MEVFFLSRFSGFSWRTGACSGSLKSAAISVETDYYWPTVALACYFCVSAAVIVKKSYVVEEFEDWKNFPFGDVGLPVPLATEAASYIHRHLTRYSSTVLCRRLSIAQVGTSIKCRINLCHCTRQVERERWDYSHVPCTSRLWSDRNRN